MAAELSVGLNKKPKTHWGKVFTRLILFFVIYSVMGWAWETLYCSISEGRYAARGFLYGPYCPVYGFGVLLILYIVHPYITKNKFILFLISSFVATVLEYFVGLNLEKVFHERLWDYSGYFLNIEGLVCLPVSVFWGVGCVIIVKYIHPKVEKAVDYLYAHFGYTLSLFIFIILITDTIYSILKSLK